MRVDRCASFEQLVVSPRVVAALQAPTGCDPNVTDDMESMTLKLIDGGKITTGTTGCRGVQPFDDVYSAIDTLEGSSVVFSSPDAGIDGAFDGDASD